MLVLAEDVEVMIAWREDGEDDAEGMLVAAHQREQLLDFSLECLVHEDGVVDFSEDLAQSHVSGVAQVNDFCHMAYVI